MDQTKAASTVIRSMAAAIERGDWSAMSTHFTDDVTYERPGYPPLTGIAALLEFYRDVRIIKTGHHDIWQVIGTEENAACWGSFTGIARDGRSLAARFADVYDLRDGRIQRRVTHFFTPAI